MCADALDALVVKVEAHSVSDEVLGTRLQTELLVDSLHGVSIKINACGEYMMRAELM